MDMGRWGTADRGLAYGKHLDVEIPQYFSWHPHISEGIEERKTQMSRSDAVFTDLQLDNRINTCILINIPELKYAGEVWGGNLKLVKKFQALYMAAANKILGCSKARSNTALRVDWECTY